MGILVPSLDDKAKMLSINFYFYLCIGIFIR